MPRRYVIVDVETTGARPDVDRVTEIALLQVDDGVEVERWEHLVQPGVPVPAMIRDITGIDDAMLADAPSFAELAEEILGRLAGRVFVAHNARFDYGFLQQELRRAGHSFEAEILCTVRLSRALYPQEHRHGLDALIARHDLPCPSRHRAMGDVLALQAFLDGACNTFAAETLAAACARAMRLPPRQGTLPEGILEGCPDSPGAYLYFASPTRGDALELPLLVGSSRSLRSRLMEQFRSPPKKGRQAELIARVRRVEWIETAGELGALLLEVQLMRRYGGGVRTTQARANQSSSGPQKRWPWLGPVIYPEHHRATGRKAYHLLDAWRLLGSYDTRAEAQAQAQASSDAFPHQSPNLPPLPKAPAAPVDPAIYRILVRWFDAPQHRDAVFSPP